MVARAHRGQERVSDSLDLDVQDAVACLTAQAEITLWASRRATSQAVSPALNLKLCKCVHESWVPVAATAV